MSSVTNSQDPIDPNSKGWNVFTVLFLIFLTLKLGEFGVVREWSWWTVTSPLWFPVAVLGMILLLDLIAKCINDLLN
jgi:hypothetical protein